MKIKAFFPVFVLVFFANCSYSYQIEIIKAFYSAWDGISREDINYMGQHNKDGDAYKGRWFPPMLEGNRAGDNLLVHRVVGVRLCNGNDGGGAGNIILNPNTSCNFYLNNETLAVKDPAPGFYKRLIVEYACRVDGAPDQVKVEAFREHTMVNLHCNGVPEERPVRESSKKNFVKGALKFGAFVAWSIPVINMIYNFSDTPSVPASPDYTSVLEEQSSHLSDISETLKNISQQFLEWSNATNHS